MTRTYPHSQSNPEHAAELLNAMNPVDGKIGFENFYETILEWMPSMPSKSGTLGEGASFFVLLNPRLCIKMGSERENTIWMIFQQEVG